MLHQIVRTKGFEERCLRVIGFMERLGHAYTHFIVPRKTPAQPFSLIETRFVALKAYGAMIFGCVEFFHTAIVGGDT